jgi:hypothetical protein
MVRAAAGGCRFAAEAATQNVPECLVSGDFFFVKFFQSIETEKICQ